MTRTFVTLELFVLWPIAALLIAVALVPMAIGFGLAYVGNHIESRLREREALS